VSDSVDLATWPIGQLTINLFFGGLELWGIERVEGLEVGRLENERIENERWPGDGAGK
jgi:hypothetical protein